jgi:TolA-binding protein
MAKYTPLNPGKFQKSKPWGYFPEEVDKRILQYEEMLRRMNDKLAERNHVEIILKKENERLKEELRKMHLQMSSLELPETDDVVAQAVLTEFKNYKCSPQTQQDMHEDADGENSGIPVDGDMCDSDVGDSIQQEDFGINSLNQYKNGNHCKNDNGDEPEFTIVK